MRRFMTVLFCLLVCVISCGEDDDGGNNGLDISTGNSGNETTSDAGDDGGSSCGPSEVFIATVDGTVYDRCMPVCTDSCQNCVADTFCSMEGCPEGEIYIAAVNGTTYDKCMPECTDACQNCVGNTFCESECPEGEVYVNTVNGETIDGCLPTCPDGNCPTGLYCVASAGICIPE